MFLSNIAHLLAGRHRSGTSRVAVMAGATLALASMALLPAAPAFATDYDFSQTTGGQQDDGHFLRIGLAKSAVIKLPADVKDVIVGDSAVVDVVIRNKTTAYLFGRSPAQTNIFFFDANGQEVLHLDLEVTLDSKAIKKLIDRTIPGNKIQVDTTGMNVVLKGTAANAVESKMAEDLALRFVNDTCECKILNTLKIAEGDQVMLKVRVVELKRTVMKQLGININSQFSVGKFDFGFNSNPMPVNQPAIFDAVGSYLDDGVSVDVQLKALETQGLATTLAEPTLTAVSGAPARFHAGGEYPYDYCTGDIGDRSCSVSFKPYGISLDFTPTVLSEGRIGLNVRTEVSDIGEITRSGEPTIDTRNAQTSVEIPSGGSMMLAGLIKDVTTQDLDGTPGLRSVPVLGALFASRSYQKNQSELVVIVTPYIVNPVHESDLATPIDGFNPPTDVQQIFFGRLNKIYGPPGKHPNGVYHGQVGYIIE
ncbi:type II and III secretion system protein family protein [Aestuariivirga sp.]|uniref:type II and III secretion system protein family protein n=1 Tax=Aestuariivirga sp. TaxID=2650926 RepID=UPI003593A967